MHTSNLHLLILYYLFLSPSFDNYVSNYVIYARRQHIASKFLSRDMAVLYTKTFYGPHRNFAHTFSVYISNPLTRDMLMTFYILSVTTLLMNVM